MAGITIDKAAKIAYRTESLYLTANSTYANARTYAIQSATDLYGAGSAEVTATTNAWYAVGVGAACRRHHCRPHLPLLTAPSKGNSQAYEYDATWCSWAASTALRAPMRGYYNGTAISTSVAAGSTQTISLPGRLRGHGLRRVLASIYADWNQGRRLLPTPAKTGVVGQHAPARADRAQRHLHGAHHGPQRRHPPARGDERQRGHQPAAAPTATAKPRTTPSSVTGGAAIAGAAHGTTHQQQRDGARWHSCYPNPATEALQPDAVGARHPSASVVGKPTCAASASQGTHLQQRYAEHAAPWPKACTPSA
ncbi:MAG: M4 family metallopeptidase [Hymenobacter sp.]